MACESVAQRHPDRRMPIVGPDESGHFPALPALTAYAQASLFVVPTWNKKYGITVAQSLAVEMPPSGHAGGVT
jgi:hypothetical protein